MKSSAYRASACHLVAEALRRARERGVYVLVYVDAREADKVEETTLLQYLVDVGVIVQISLKCKVMHRKIGALFALSCCGLPNR
jgi:hypothetical protein